MMTYEERQVIREVSLMLQQIRVTACKINAPHFNLGAITALAGNAALKLDSLLVDPDDLPSEAYDANDSQEMGRL